MKSTQSLALLLSVMLLTACAGTANTSSTQAAGSQSAAAAPTGDAAIAENVKKALAADPATKDLNVNVESNDGRVRLKGEVRSVAAFQKATSVARSVPGVTAVENHMVVCMTCK